MKVLGLELGFGSLGLELGFGSHAMSLLLHSLGYGESLRLVQVQKEGPRPYLLTQGVTRGY